MAFADHLSVAAPALAEVGGTLYCVHRGAREGEEEQLPVRWTSFTPASAQPFIAALEKASKPLPEGASDEKVEERRKAVQAAADALATARKWSPDADASSLFSGETPALVNDNGTLPRMVYTSFGGYYDPGSSALWETYLERGKGAGHWTRPKRIGGHYDGWHGVAPALASYNGAVHLMFVHPQMGNLVHLVRDGEGTWTEVTAADGEEITPPSVDTGSYRRAVYLAKSLGKAEAKKWGIAAGYPGNLALAVHDGKLHLLYRKTVEEPFLFHAEFDGSTWSKEKEAGLPSRRSAALASLGGKLHAVFPSWMGDKLCHGFWTEADGWGEPVELKGHDSNNTPALLAVKDGPAGAERDALLLVHRGVDRYVPPPPPTPPAPPKVVSQGKTVHGKAVTDYGGGHTWSRVRHYVSLTPATMDDGSKGLIASWDADAEYWWGFSYYPENYGGAYKAFITGTLWLNKEGSRNFLKSADFQGSADSAGRLHHSLVFTGLEPGTYILTNSSAKTIKTGGYWAHNDATFNDDDDNDDQFWARVICSKARVTITI
ncbi:hypothetical protein [Streptomyces sp. P9-1]|uniref:hypothetical protein n=1 Tax=Streptomyces sp. P9-1 TaxID=3422589 RepID=UPI003D363E60